VGELVPLLFLLTREQGSTGLLVDRRSEPDGAAECVAYFAVRSTIVNGFCRQATPSSRTPWRTIASSV
jgi:hypothetical protein